jgi:hypothetical protein
MDRARHYWIFQVAISFGIATFFFALALFYRNLPNDPWERLLNPTLLSPTIASIIVSYRILFRHKRTLNGDDLLFRHFIWGMRLMGFGFATALAVAITGKLERFFH